MADGNSATGKTEVGEKGPRGGVEAVDRALSILKAFRDGEDRLSLAQIAQRTGFYKSTILRLAVSLERQGFLARLADKSFAPGSELLRLGGLYQRSLKLEDRVRPALRRLLEKTGESASFFVRQGEQRLCLFREDSGHAVRDHVVEGEFLGIGRGAAGHIIRRFAPALTQRGELDQQMSELPIFSFGERVAEVAAGAVPVFWLRDNRMGLAGALTLSGPISRFTDSACQAMRQPLLEEGARLSRELGASLSWEMLQKP